MDGPAAAATGGRRGVGPVREVVVGTLVFDGELMEQLRLRETRFSEHAYLFVLASLEYLQAGLPERRHVDGRELAHAVRVLALDRFGVMARLVLEHWGVRSTADLGDIVFALVDAGVLLRRRTDRRCDFLDVYDFDEAFGTSYPWSAAHLT